MVPFIQNIETPIGAMQIVADQQAILSILFTDQRAGDNPNSVTQRAALQLNEYFQGARQSFDLPLAAQGTDFQKTVWRALSEIKYGQTRSYADIAKSINNPRAVRAVGTANGCNPMTIVVPCHRVIGSNGALTGYASGVERKSWLLNHESSRLL
jgi:methylated-DNA-[protein]-cysteine S-methyltransferase